MSVLRCQGDRTQTGPSKLLRVAISVLDDYGGAAPRHSTSPDPCLRGRQQLQFSNGCRTNHARLAVEQLAGLRPDLACDPTTVRSIYSNLMLDIRRLFR